MNILTISLVDVMVKQHLAHSNNVNCNALPQFTVDGFCLQHEIMTSNHQLNAQNCGYTYTKPTFCLHPMQT